MLTGFAIIFLSGLILSVTFKKLRLPGLLGMIVAGIIISPNALDLLDESVINIAAQLRQAALVIILTRAGLSLDINDLKRVGRPAVLLCFVPACFEMAGTILLAPKLLGVSYVEAAVMGSVIAAVSPAVIVPRMIRLMDEEYGTKKSIPQMILAGASADDVFVIVMFSVFCAMAAGGSVSLWSFIQIPVSIALGIVLGIVLGFLNGVFFKRFHMRDSVKLIIMLSVSFLMIELEASLKGIVPVSGLLAIMSMAMAIKQSCTVPAKRLAVKYNKLWVGAELVLFVLVGAAVDLRYAVSAGIGAVVLVFGALVFRSVGVALCTVKTKLNLKERVFCVIAYMPKATVQAAIGAVPLAMGLSCGNAVLTAAVLSILITAPLGAILIDTLYKKLL